MTQTPRSRRWAAALLLALAAGCRPGEAPPDATYRAFAHAVAEGDVVTAWALLAPDTQAWLTERARAAAAAAPGVVSNDPRRMLVGDAAGAAPALKAVTVLRESRDRAVVRAEDQGGSAAEVELVRVGAGWRVLIPRAR